MSHEVRTPLAAIQSASANLLEVDPASVSPHQHAMIAEIQEANERLNRLVGKIFQITRLESGHVTPKTEFHDVGDLVSVAEYRTRKELQGHSLITNVPVDLPLVEMDFELMLHSLTNLLSNAAFHTPENSKITLTVRVEGSELVFTVADTGPGIPPKSLPHLFDKFYRAPNSRPGGSGLGLSLVKGFVEAQGGQVRAENSPTGGAVFTITLPLRKPDELTVAPLAAAS
jgi:two-component system sensor histidine kinase KdpD